MARLARVVAPGVAHHVTQRGNRRQQTFFSDEDYAAYREMIGEGCRSAGVKILAYCLMPNHVHLVLVPADEDGLRAALSEAHRRYSRRVNFREGWRGYLWQGRFASVAMDDIHLLACLRYVELNPVRARLVARPRGWPWSSAHLEGLPDPLVSSAGLPNGIGDWADFLGQGLSDAAHAAIRQGERTGRPLGSEAFIARLEADLNRPLAKRKAGRPRKASEEEKLV